MNKKISYFTFFSLFIIFSIVFYALGFTSFYVFASDSDKIIAVVGKEVITQSEAEAYLKVISLQLSREFSGKELEEKTEEAKKESFARMVEDKIILQEAKRQGMRARQDKLKYKIEEMKESFASEAEFSNTFKQKGLTIKDLELRMADQIIMREIVEREVKNKIVVSPDEVTAFYEKHKDEFLQPGEYLVDTIYTEDELILEKLIAALNESPDFKTQAGNFNAVYSSDRIAKFEGTRPEIREALGAVKINGITPPLKIGNGYYIFKLNEITAPKAQSLISAHNQINNYLFQEKFAQKMIEWLDDLKSKMYIEIKV